MKRYRAQTVLESIDGLLLHLKNKTLRKHVNRIAAKAIRLRTGVSKTTATVVKISIWRKANLEQKTDLYNPHSLLLSLEMF